MDMVVMGLLRVKKLFRAGLERTHLEDLEILGIESLILVTTDYKD